MCNRFNSAQAWTASFLESLNHIIFTNYFLINCKVVISYKIMRDVSIVIFLSYSDFLLLPMSIFYYFYLLSKNHN